MPDCHVAELDPSDPRPAAQRAAGQSRRPPTTDSGPRGHVRSKTCTARSHVPPRSLVSQTAGVRAGRRTWSPSATWTRATGPPTSPAGRMLRLPAHLGPADEQPDGRAAPDAVGAAGAGHRPRPGPGLPRLLQPGRPLDPVRPLRDRHRRLRPGRGARHGDRAATAHRAVGLFGGHGIPLVWAVVITGLDVLPAAGHPAAAASARWRRSSCRWSATIGACFIVEIFLSQARSVGDRRRASSRRDALPTARCCLHRDRHPRRHGDAAQPLPALGAGAEPRRVEQTPDGHRPGVPVQPDRLGGRAELPPSSSTPPS